MLALGIDLLEHELSLALVESTGRNARLRGSWRETLSDARPRGEQIRAAIARHVTNPPEAVATAMPGRSVAYRILRLPFADQRRLQATVPFELESLVPFELESAVSTFSVLERDAQSSVVLAGIARRDEVLEHLDAMRAAGIDPAIVDVGALAAAGLVHERVADALLIEPRADGAVALLRDGRLAGVRVIDATSPGDVVREARWSALALADGASLPRLVAFAGAGETRDLGASLGLEPLPLAQVLPAWTAGAEPACLRAVALAGRAAGLLTLGINFRVGDLAYHPPREEARRQLRLTGALAVAAGLLALVSLAAAFTERRSELGALQDEIRASVAKDLPNATRGSERIQLQDAVASLQKRAELLGGGNARPAAVDVLRSIGEAVPERVPFQVDDCTIEDDGVRLHARTDSYESVDVIKRALAAAAHLRDPQVKDVKTGVDGRIEFRVALAYAKEGEG
jgi:general secretion pathway protein L